MPSLTTLISYFAKHAPWDADHYPAIANMSDQQRLAFQINHSALHFAKTAGNICAISEAAEHGKEITVEPLKVHVAKSLINTLRFAAVLGMTEEELVKVIEEKYGERMASSP
jgi:hypothetical protein